MEAGTETRHFMPRSQAELEILLLEAKLAFWDEHLLRLGELDSLRLAVDVLQHANGVLLSSGETREKRLRMLTYEMEAKGPLLMVMDGDTSTRLQLVLALTELEWMRGLQIQEVENAIGCKVEEQKNDDGWEDLTQYLRLCEETKMSEQQARVEWLGAFLPCQTAFIVYEVVPIVISAMVSITYVNIQLPGEVCPTCSYKHLPKYTCEVANAVLSSKGLLKNILWKVIRNGRKTYAKFRGFEHARVYTSSANYKGCALEPITVVAQTDILSTDVDFTANIPHLQKREKRMRALLHNLL